MPEDISESPQRKDFRKEYLKLSDDGRKLSTALSLSMLVTSVDRPFLEHMAFGEGRTGFDLDKAIEELTKAGLIEETTLIKELEEKNKLGQADGHDKQNLEKYREDPNWNEQQWRLEKAYRKFVEKL